MENIQAIYFLFESFLMAKLILYWILGFWTKVP